MNPPDTLDDLINGAHLEAERQESEAATVDKRQHLANLPHSAQWFALPRPKGSLRNPYQKGSAFFNLTIRAHLEKADDALASFLARQAGTSTTPIDYAAQEKEEQRLAAAQAMVEQTEILRQRNQALREKQDQFRLSGGVNKPGSRNGLFL
jgi:hypothetical protein